MTLSAKQRKILRAPRPEMRRLREAQAKARAAMSARAVRK